MITIRQWISLLQHLSKNKTVVVWGTGKYAQLLSEFLELNDLEIDYYLDNDPEAGVFRDKPVRMPSEIVLADGKHQVFTIIGSSYVEEISKQCKSLGLREFEDYVLPIQYFILLGLHNTRLVEDAHQSESDEPAGLKTVTKPLPAIVDIGPPKKWTL